MVDDIAKIDSLENLSTLPGLNNLESRTAKNILSSLLAPGGVGANINLLNNFIDGATANVSKKLDTALQ
jgi:enhancing lycopene biosynthesis protein 2